MKIYSIIKSLMFLFILIGVIAFIAAFLYYSLVVKPRSLCEFYAKQGLDMEFRFGDGFNGRDSDNVIKHGDYAYHEKHVLSKNPEARIFGGNMGGFVTLCLFDPNLKKEFINVEEKYYAKPHIYDIIRIGAESGLVFAQGNQWRKHRKILSTAFHFELLKNMIPTMVNVTMNHFKQLKSQKEANLRDLFESIAGEVVGKLFFGDEFHEYKLNGVKLTLYLKELIFEAFKITYTLPNLVFGVKFIRAKILPRHKVFMEKAQLFLDFCSEKIQEKIKFVKENKGKLDKPSLLDNMILQALENSADGLEIKEIVDEFATFVVAGMDTTGHSLAMAAYYYSTQPETHAKLKEEIDLYMKDINNISYDDINKMVYLQSFFNETLRMNAPTFRGFHREALEDHMIGDVKIKNGTFVHTSFFSVNYCEKYHQDPFKFIPERWIDNDSKSKISSQKDAFVFTPFSIGPRVCIGKNLSLLESRIVLGLFIKHFDFKLIDNYKLIMTMGFLYEPKDDIVVKITPKEN